MCVSERERERERKSVSVREIEVEFECVFLLVFVNKTFLKKLPKNSFFYQLKIHQNLALTRGDPGGSLGVSLTLKAIHDLLKR